MLTKHYETFIAHNFNKDILRSIGKNAVIRLFYLEKNERILFQKDINAHRQVYLLEGKGRVLHKENHQNINAKTSSISCLLLDYAKNNQLDVIADGNMLLCRADLEQLDFVMSWQVMLHDAEIKDRKTKELLKKICRPAVFSGVPMAHIENLIQSMKMQSVKAGEVVVEQGDSADTFYLISFGHMEVWQQGLYDNEQVKVADLWPGDHFGEEALIAEGTRNATVRCAEDTIMLTLDKASFETLIKAPMVSEIGVTPFKAEIAKGAHLLDVRYEEEFDDGHIPNATLIPLYQLRSRIDELDKNQKQIIYCLSGKRSAIAAMILREFGFDTVCLRDGTRNWPDELVSEY